MIKQNKLQDNSKVVNQKIECNKCKEMFDENDVDIVDGDWLCRECEKGY